MAVRPHIHLGVLIMAIMLAVGLVMAVLGPTLIRRKEAATPAMNDRSDSKHWNNDTGLQWFR